MEKEVNSSKNSEIIKYGPVFVLEFIEEEGDEDDDSESESESEGSLFSIDIFKHERVFVGVGHGKNDSSMDALLWTLNHAVTASTNVHLIHVFPLLRLVPSPLGGMLPKSQASPKAVEIYLAQQRDKRKKLLQNYIDVCSAAKVKVETTLIESGIPSEAILQLISTLKIRKLVLGSTKSSLRKVKSRRGTASQILEKAPQNCEIKIIYKREELDDESFGSPSSRDNSRNSSSTQEGDQVPVIRSPDMVGPESPSVGTNVSGHIWSVFKWVGTKPTSNFGSGKKTETNISGLHLQENLLN
ncbi:U-box domain-containing protein 33-like [Humulus lupulus]|uniref:U-box domain-containing protein 33-like n=1 Tax=Humulus lupulus TaxID=3486 RepID=UPI002B40A048|nr:U-box domain-containing protein 33-like [Humulus lupulus]XP_062111159.1 U-box domain-containing protein 33-like [Humulus lupulus]